MIDPIAPAISAFRDILSALPQPITALIGLVITLFIVIGIFHIIPR